MANDKIKVVGYAKKEVYNGDIEYRNFSPDLVGFQQADGASTFTLGNFAITTTLDTKPSKVFTTNKFSNFVSLCDLDLSEEESKVLLNNNSEVKLKLDRTDMCNYAYFGNLLDYVRVSLEEIITKWPAALFATPIKERSRTNLTVEDYIYIPLIDEATFKVNVNYINNPYQINYLQNGSILNTFNETNDMRNLSANYLSYSILVDGDEYSILDFTGATQIVDDYLYFTVKGDPFVDITGVTATTQYHIKPNKLKEDEFFNALPDFENNLLNTFTVPQYTSTYKFPKVSEAGRIIFDTKTLTWPTTDGYNIDFDSTEYLSFVSDLIEIATNFDDNKTNLMVRFLTSESISDFDTVPRCDNDVEEETAGQKMNRTLKIYGREYDEIKRYIDGIQYANTVTYNQLNNTPDAILKYLARTMGWDLVSSVLENDLLKNYVTTTDSTYSGMSRGYTAVEAEIEMWRRIILNTPWLWKSKGARKSIEFLFKFIGAPDGLIEFNEFIYVAKEKLDVNLFKVLLEQNGLPTDIDLYNVDSDGYPRVPNNNSDMYFQKGGKWYRQTSGSASTVDILTGNNPHVGPYDGGAAYIKQFTSLIPNFSAVTVTSTTVTTDITNLFTNYSSGTFNSYEGEYSVDVVSDDNVDLSECILVVANKVLDPFPTAGETTDCGCDVIEDDYALKLDIECPADPVTTNQDLTDCVDKVVAVKETAYNEMIFTFKNYDENGIELPTTYTSKYISKECCSGVYGGFSLYDEEWVDGVLENCGYICSKNLKAGCAVTCAWSLATTNYNDMPTFAPYTEKFLVFEKEDGTTTSVMPTGCSCIENYTTSVAITDPATGESGVGCMLTQLGVTELTVDDNSYFIIGVDNVLGFSLVPGTTPPRDSYPTWIEAVYEARRQGVIPCDEYMNQFTGELPIDLGGDIGTNTGTGTSPVIQNTKR